MRTAIALGAVTLTVAALAGPSAGSPSSEAGCKPGPGKIGGADVRTFCGPAKAVVRVAGKTYRFSGGRCTVQEGFKKGEKTIAVNIGTITLPPASPKSRYFGVLVDGTKDRTYKDQAVSWQIPGKGFAVLFNTVVVSSRGKKGSFTGRARSRGKPVGLAKGSWTC